MKIFCSSLLVIFLAQPVFAQQAVPGEQCKYVLKIIGIPAATIALSVGDTGRLDGRTVCTIEATAATNAFFSKFYALDNRYFTTVDLQSGLPVHYRKIIRQKTIEQDLDVAYDLGASTASYRGDKFDGMHITTLESSHNLFSMIFSLRRQLQLGQQIVTNLDIETEPWKAVMTVDARESLEVSGRHFDAWRVSISFVSVQPEKKRKNTDILTRRLVRSKTKLIFWLDSKPPYTFLRVDVDAGPANAITELTEKN